MNPYGKAVVTKLRHEYTGAQIMTKKRGAVENLISVSIGRQPIFDEKRRLWGYSLVCVGESGAMNSATSAEEDVSISVASSACMGLQQIVDRGRKVMVTFSEKSILGHLPYALPPELIMVQVSREVLDKPSMPEALLRLKSDGYSLAVHGFDQTAGFNDLYSLADVISLDVSGMTRTVLADAVSRASYFSCGLLAMQVQDGAQLLMCRDLGFSLFHGAFFKLPDTVEVHKLTSNEVARFNLLHMLEQEDPDFDKLAESFQSDVSVSFRLLTYLNSAAFGLRQKIKSINHAIALLGWRKMKTWLRVVLLNDMSQKAEAPELMMVAVQRGKFLECIAKDHDFWGFDPELLHLLGIFSLLDAMLGMPMTEIVTYLPLDTKLRAALCREPNNEYLPLLQLAQYYEDARWEEGRVMTQKLNLNSTKVQAAFQTSVDWANEMVTLNTSQTHG
jgi:EAL and modified HD-GYP domain-containing signal transduction protein